MWLLLHPEEEFSMSDLAERLGVADQVDWVATGCSGPTLLIVPPVH